MNPSLLKGQNYHTVRSALKGTKGWQNDVMRHTRGSDKGWMLREMNARGTNYTGRSLMYHPGTPRHFGGRPYWKLSTGSKKIKFPL
jgi:hypothetical protein